MLKRLSLVLIFIFTGCFNNVWAGEFKVQMTDDWVFIPETIETSAGDAVTWVNEEYDTHNIVFEDKSVTSSGNVKRGGQFSTVFTKAGRYKYYCRFHRDNGMRGAVVVK